MEHDEHLTSDKDQAMAASAAGADSAAVPERPALPERRCILTGAHGPRTALIRLAVGPDMQVAVDLVDQSCPGAAPGSSPIAPCWKPRCARASCAARWRGPSRPTT